MRISAWSADVCSSDLFGPLAFRRRRAISMDAERLHVVLPNRREGDVVIGQRGDGVAIGGVDHEDLLPVALLLLHVGDVIDAEQQEVLLRQRSEEHTSELQSLMRISYAVFCLKKKNNKKT